MVEDWYWAAAKGEPAADRFVIANGKEELWRRVRLEVDAERDCAWNAVHPTRDRAALSDILEMMFLVVPVYRVSQNRFVFEAAQIPTFAEFLRHTRADLGNYVSNSVFLEVATKPEPYSDSAMRQLGRIVSSTLHIESDWF